MISRLVLQRLREKPLVYIKLHHSGIHQIRSVRETLRSLGLSRPHSFVYHRNTPEIRGKIKAVRLLSSPFLCVPGA